MTRTLLCTQFHPPICQRGRVVYLISRLHLLIKDKGNPRSLTCPTRTQISEHGLTQAQCTATQMNYPYIKSPDVILTAAPSSGVPPPLISLFFLPPSPFALMTLTAKFLESYSRLQRVTFNGIQSCNSESGHSWPLASLPPTLPPPSFLHRHGNE